MAGLFAQFATNRKAEVEGVEVTFGSPNEDGSIPTFRVSRMGKQNKRYQKMLETETKPHIFAIRNENFPAELDEAITLKIFIATILLDWKNVRVPELFTEEEHSEVSLDGEGGQTRYLPLTPENAEKLFKALPELFIALKDNAQKMSLFRDQEIAADSKI